MGMQHSFDIAIAKKYGINCAVLLNNICFWIEKNRANEKNFHDGKYWTYNTKKAFSILLPYLTERQIDYALKKLIDEGLLISGNYNTVAYDRTLWYAITDFGYSILQNCEMETPNLQNGIYTSVQPIPDINTDINTNIKTDSIYAPCGATPFLFSDDINETQKHNNVCKHYTDIEKKIEIEKEREKDSTSDMAKDATLLKSAKKEKPAKHKYGEYNNVLLTDDELDKLKEKFTDWEDRIERLSGYIESKGAKYKSHYATILNWSRREKEQPRAATYQKSHQREYCVYEGEDPLDGLF